MFENMELIEAPYHLDKTFAKHLRKKMESKAKSTRKLHKTTTRNAYKTSKGSALKISYKSGNYLKKVRSYSGVISSITPAEIKPDLSLIDKIKTHKSIFSIFAKPIVVRLSWDTLIGAENSMASALRDKSDIVLLMHGFNYLAKGKENLVEVEFSIKAPENCWVTRSLCPGDQWETHLKLGSTTEVALDANLEFTIPTVSVPVSGPVNLKAGAGLKVSTDNNFILCFGYTWKTAKILAAGISNYYGQWEMKGGDFPSNVCLALAVEVPKKETKLRCDVQATYHLSLGKFFKFFKKVPYNTKTISQEFTID